MLLKVQMVENTSSTFLLIKNKQPEKVFNKQLKLQNLWLELTSIAQAKMALWGIFLWRITEPNLSKEALWTMAHVVLR